MASEKNILKLMCYSRNTLYVWKREKRPIVKLIEKYLTDDDILEFLKTGKIEKQEQIIDFERLSELLEIEKKYNQIIKVIEGK